ncbi:HAD hydrolase-like protein [Patescibacteria group bacterium]|nr:HAD hydrolase-like protein [Patescibacteria group bacterium]
MIKLVAFDWNGTIFADTYAVYQSNNENFKLLKIKPPSFSDFQKYYDFPVKKFYTAMGVSSEDFDKNTKRTASSFLKNYESRINKIRTRAYAKEALKWLLENNIRSVIFSNHVIDSIKKHLKRLKIEQYFADLIGNTAADLPLQGRTKKDRLKAYMEKHRFLPSETMIIGDTTEEIEIGKELKVISIAITHGNVSTARLKSAKPDYLISSLKEVIGIITNC